MKKLMSMTAGAFLLMAGVASAATVTSNAVFDGQTEVYGNAGQTVQADFQVHVNAGEVFHAIRTKVDSQATVCTEVGPFEGDQTVSVPVNITLPPNSNSGGYSLVADIYTTDTLPQAQAMNGDLACSSNGSGAHVASGAYNGGTVVNVLPTSGNSTGSSSSSESKWQAILNGLQAILAKMTATSTNTGAATPPVVSPKCTTIAPYRAAPIGTYSALGVQLQSALLLDNPYAIPALKPGSSVPMGYRGPQTEAALATYLAVNSCN